MSHSRSGCCSRRLRLLFCFNFYSIALLNQCTKLVRVSGFSQVNESNLNPRIRIVSESHSAKIQRLLQQTSEVRGFVFAHHYYLSHRKSQFRDGGSLLLLQTCGRLRNSSCSSFMPCSVSLFPSMHFQTKTTVPSSSLPLVPGWLAL